MRLKRKKSPTLSKRLPAVFCFKYWFRPEMPQPWEQWSPLLPNRVKNRNGPKRTGNPGPNRGRMKSHPKSPLPRSPNPHPKSLCGQHRQHDEWPKNSESIWDRSQEPGPRGGLPKKMWPGIRKPPKKDSKSHPLQLKWRGRPVSNCLRSPEPEAAAKSLQKMWSGPWRKERQRPCSPCRIPACGKRSVTICTPAS